MEMKSPNFSEIRMSIKKSLILLLFVTGLAFNTKAQTIDPNYWDGKVYFKLQNSSDTIPDYNGGGEPPAYIADLVSKYNITKLYRPFVSANSLTLKSIYRMEFSSFSAINQVIMDLTLKSSTEYAEKIPIDQIFATPTDPLYAANQWYLPQIAAPAAFDLYIPQAGKGIVNIAIVDNEIRTTHTDLAAIMLPGKDVPDNDTDTNPPNASFNHGTHCAGIAAAVTNNANGIASLNYPVGGVNYLKIIPVKVTSNANPNPGIIEKGYEGIQWAADNGAKVISCSWGGTVSTANQSIVDYAYSKGCIIVAAAGNKGTNELLYPASCNHVISVGATNNLDKKASFSTFNNAIDVMAPGQGIFSTFSMADNVSYGTLSGTSMACPLTAGLVGLMWSYNPNLTQSALESCLKSSCTDISAQNPGLNGLIGSGRINAAQALACIPSTQAIFADFTSDYIQVCANQTVQFTDKSGGNVTGWLWNFGDGSPNSNLKNPAHVYNAPIGTTFTVTLTASGPGGNNTIVKNVYITIMQPDAQITGQAATTVCDNSPQAINLQFTGNPPFTVKFSNGIQLTGLQSLTTSVIISVKQGDSPLTITSMSDGGGCTGTFSGQANFTFVACCPSVLTNGDFTGGNTLTNPANTDLNFNLLYAPTNYNVYNATTSSSGSWPMRATLPNRGLNMAYDGYGTAPNTTPAPNHTRVWCQTVSSLQSNTNYSIQFFTTSHPAVYGPVQFQIRLNDALNGTRFIGSAITVPPSNVMNWNQCNVSYTTPPVAMSNVEVCLCQVNNHNTTGYDLYIDDISMRPNIPPTINAGPDVSICAGESTIIGTPSQAGLTYLWTPATGLNNPNIAQPTATPGVTTTYTLVITNTATGCQANDNVTVTINNNCCIGAWNAPATISTNTTIATPAFVNASITQNLTITAGTLTFDNINVMMANNVKITVNNGAKLVITNSAHLYACTKLWDGIYVDAGGEVDIDNNGFVEDATNAIVSNNGGKYVLNGAILNKNLIGIQVNALNATHTGTIINSIVTSRSLPIYPAVIDLKTTNPLTSSTKSVLKAPYADRKGCYGINVTDVTNINIGSSASAANLNIFDNIMCGINLTRSNGIIYNNTFQYLLGYSGFSCPGGNPPPLCLWAAGIGVQAAGDVAGTGTSSVTIGGVSSNQANIFNNTYQAVFVQQYKTHTILGNSITNTSTGPFTGGTLNYGNIGIYVTSPAASNVINISNQTIIKNCANGIWVNRNNNNALNTTSLSIQNNGTSPTQCITADAGGYCTTGIYISDLLNGTTTQPTGWGVSQNIITETENCISLLNVKNPYIGSGAYNIMSNSCTVHYKTGTTNTNGIVAKGCAQIAIATNHIKYNNVGGTAYTAGGNIKSYGIYLQKSTNMLVSCNQIDDAARSMVFDNNCLSTYMPPGGSWGVRTNTIKRAQDGFVLLNSGIIGQQGTGTIPSNNFWDLTTTPTFINQTNADNSNATSSILYVNNVTTGAQATRPLTNAFIGAGTAYLWNTSLLSSSGSPEFTCGAVPAAPLAMSGPERGVEKTAYYEYLKTIVEDTKQLPVYSDASQWQRKKYVFNEIKKDVQLTDNLSLQNFYNNNTNTSIGRLLQVDENIIQGNYNNASAINKSVLAGNVWEKNQQTINGLILSKLISPTYSYTVTDKNTIATIAKQCPISGGDAVYQARVLLMSIENNVIEFIDNCNPGETRSMEETPEGISNFTVSKAFKIYPNPNDGNMILEYSLTSQSVGVFVLYDITGREINKYKLSEGENNFLKISESNLENGVYFYSVIIDHVEKAYNKIIIAK